MRNVTGRNASVQILPPLWAAAGDRSFASAGYSSPSRLGHDGLDAARIMRSCVLALRVLHGLDQEGHRAECVCAEPAAALGGGRGQKLRFC